MQRKYVFYTAKKKILQKTHKWIMISFGISSYICVWLCSVVKLQLFLYSKTLEKTGFVPVDGWLLLAQIWENEDGEDMVVWAEAKCSVPLEESPALWIGELMHGGDLHSFSNPCWRHWLLSHADSSKTRSKKTRFGFFIPPPFASFSELLLT